MEFLLEHLVMAACAVARALAAVEAAALPVSSTVIQDMVSNALAQCLPELESRERAQLSLELQMVLDRVGEYLNARSLRAEAEQSSPALRAYSRWSEPEHGRKRAAQVARRLQGLEAVAMRAV